MFGGDSGGEGPQDDGKGWMDVSLAAAGVGPVARLRAILESLVDPHVLLLLVRGADDRMDDIEFVDANAAACTHLGTAYEELIGSRATDVRRQPIDPTLMRALAELLVNDDVVALDDFPVEFDGESRRFDVRAVNLGTALSVTWRDVTEGHHQTARFQALAENAADIVLFSRDGVLQWVSPSVTDVLGWTPGECVGLTGDSFVHPDDLDLMLESRVLLYSGRPTGYRLRMVRKDGGIVWCEARGRAIAGDAGGVEGAVVSMRDITDQVEAELQTEAAEARYRLVAEHVSDVVYVADPDGDFAWVSPSVEAVAGWTAEELVGTPVALLLAPEDHATREELRKVVFGDARSPEPVEVRIRTRTGARRWVSVRADPVLDADGVVAAAVCSLRLCHSEVVERWAAATLSAGTALLVTATDEQELLVDMCETAVRNGGYRLAWYGRKVDAPGCPVAIVAMSEAERTYLDGFAATWDDGPLGQGPTGRALQSGRTCVEQDMASNSDYAPWRERALLHRFGSGISLPVPVNGAVDGVLNVYAAEPNAFEPRVVALLEDLARSLGFGIERLRDRRDLEVAFANSIDLIAAVVESRDPYTSGHQVRVAELSTAIACRLGIDQQRIQGLTYAATIHDVGKVGVPIDLLSRPGRLAEEELALIRCHSQIGWEIASRFEWPWPVADIVRQHHERIDGSGYPLGLRGDEILLEARIVAVADVYEAASSRRPYRAALGGDRARAIVSGGSGTLFDAEVVGAFERVLDDGFTFAVPVQRP